MPDRPFAFHELQAEEFPLTIEFIDRHGEVVHTIEVSGPGSIEIPPLAKEYGPVASRITTATGYTSTQEAPPAMCGCGQPIHYEDSPHGAALRAYVEDMVESLGATVAVSVEGVGTFAVPRHYIALHGIKGKDVPELVKLHGWPQ